MTLAVPLPADALHAEPHRAERSRRPGPDRPRRRGDAGRGGGIATPLPAESLRREPWRPAKARWLPSRTAIRGATGSGAS